MTSESAAAAGTAKETRLAFSGGAAALHRPLGGGAAAGAGAATRPRRPGMVASSLPGRLGNARRHERIAGWMEHCRLARGKLPMTGKICADMSSCEPLTMTRSGDYS